MIFRYIKKSFEDKNLSLMNLDTDAEFTVIL